LRGNSIRSGQKSALIKLKGGILFQTQLNSEGGSLKRFLLQYRPRFKTQRKGKFALKYAQS